MKGTNGNLIKGQGTFGRWIALILKGKMATRWGTEGNCLWCRWLSRGLLQIIYINQPFTNDGGMI